MRLISWNINYRTDCIAHVKALHRRNADLVALQEVNPTIMPILHELLRKIGLIHITDNSALCARSERKHYGALIASRWPIKPLPSSDFVIPYPETVLSAKISTPGPVLEIHTTHIPPGSTHGWIKIKTFEGIFKRLACKSVNARILCGDFNSPRRELPDGQIITWGQTESGRIRKGRARWDSGERNVIDGLKEYDLTDIFRLLNGYKVQEFSWQVKRLDTFSRRRFDHIFASRNLNPTTCKYLHRLRKLGLSDHSPIEADFQPPA